MNIAHTYRHALVRELLTRGPGAPTLCDGWRSQELAAHLYVREYRPLASLGILLGPLHERTERLIRSLAASASSSSGYERLVHQWGAGRGRFPLLRLAAVDNAVNVLEFFVHQEDVRRAAPAWQPRECTSAQDQVLWGYLRGRVSFLYRHSPVGVVVEGPGGEQKVAKRAQESVVITGAPQELVLHAFGRGEQAQVNLSGPAHAVAELRQAQQGI